MQTLLHYADTERRLRRLKAAGSRPAKAGKGRAGVADLARNTRLGANPPLIIPAALHAAAAAHLGNRAYRTGQLARWSS